MSVQASCIISFWRGFKCFNTSYVSVQALSATGLKKSVSSFNTSYVSVQGVEPNIRGSISSASFNTSYVSVQALAITLGLKSVAFQYILCVGSSNSRGNYYCRTYVSIHPMCRFKEVGKSLEVGEWLFQYILCVGSRRCQRSCK